jgi:2-amino-4-hydroxy-6-hydroxymethyldihydropteridine diphosphokinase
VGRVRGVPNAPRTLDLDLLLYGSLVVRSEAMTVPHPRMHERRFVLAPLLEIAPDARHPVLGLTVAEMAAACADSSAVAVYGPPELLG